VAVTRRRLLVGLTLSLAAAALAFLVSWTPLARTLEWKIYDLQLRGAASPAAARQDIVIVRIDERSIRELESFVGRWPWPRLVHAKLVDFLARGPARAVAYDVLFTERDRRRAFDVGPETWSGEESDAAFAEAVARAGNVVLLADATFEGLIGGQGAPGTPGAGLPAYDVGGLAEVRPTLGLPYAALAKAARGIGHNLLVLDADGPVRRHVPFVRTPSGTVPSLAVATLVAAEELGPGAVRASGASVQLGTHALPLTPERLPVFAGAAGEAGTAVSWRFLVNFRGPAVLDDGTTTVYREFSALDLLQAEEQIAEGLAPAVDPALFRDRIVVVGVTAAGLHDVFAVPFAAGGKMTGGAVHANVIDQVLSSRFIRPAGLAARLGLVAACALLGALSFVLVRVRLAAGLSALGMLALAGLTQWAFRRGVWLPAALPALGLAFSAVGGLGYAYFVEGSEKRAVKRLFSRYLSRDVYDQLIANPSLAELGGRRRDMSVLFSDIRGFTTLTEQGRAEQVVEQLNEYFSRMVDVVFEHRGTLDKFVGDMVMALFGAPLDDPRHADHAVETALEMIRQLDVLNEQWAARGRPGLAIGIGINSGEMIAGNIGAEKVRSYTVIGDAVNLGSRLQALNKEHGTTIIVSEHTASRLEKQYDLRPLGTVVVKGRTQPVAIFEVVVPPAPGRP
jgi:adenylate cyclase